MHHKPFDGSRPGLAQPSWGSLQSSPDNLAGLMGWAPERGREVEERGIEMKKSGVGRKGWKEVEGKGPHKLTLPSLGLQGNWFRLWQHGTTKCQGISHCWRLVTILSLFFLVFGSKGVITRTLQWSVDWARGFYRGLHLCDTVRQTLEAVVAVLVM